MLTPSYEMAANGPGTGLQLMPTGVLFPAHKIPGRKRHDPCWEGLGQKSHDAQGDHAKPKNFRAAPALMPVCVMRGTVRSP